MQTFTLVCFIFERGSCSVAQAGFELSASAGIADVLHGA